jgi:hypothetical protein
MTQPSFTRAEKRAEIEREIVKRKHTYPRLIKGGRLDATAAAHQIAVMKAIALDYGPVAEVGHPAVTAAIDLEQYLRDFLGGPEAPISLVGEQIYAMGLMQRLKALSDAIRAERVN